MPFENASLVWELKWDADWVTAVEFIGDSRRLVAGNRLGQLLEWNLPEKLEGDAPKPVRQLNGHSNSITALRSTKDGASLFSSSFDHSIRRWNPQAEAAGEGEVTLNARAIYEAEVRGKGKESEPETCAVKICDQSDVLGGHEEWVTVMMLSQDESLLVSGDDSGQVIVRNRESGEEIRRWEVTGWVHALALSPDNQRAVISERYPVVFDSGRHSAIRLWDAGKGEPLADLSGGYKKMYLSAAAWSPDSNRVVIGRGEEAEGSIWMLDPAEDCKQLQKLSPIHQYGVTDFLFHPDGKHLFSAGRDTVIRIWEVESGKMVKELGKPRGGQFKDWIHNIALNADATLLAAADMAGQVNVWKLT
ncbi:MAG: hypothetical protein ACI8UO_006079 [Verrucomicrobiales bacterium]|jgi:hypothetical protein